MKNFRGMLMDTTAASGSLYLFPIGLGRIRMDGKRIVLVADEYVSING